MATVIIVLIAALVISNLCWFVWLRKKDKQEPSVEQKPEEPPVDEPKPDNSEPKFKVGDYVVGDCGSGRIVEITDDAYLLDTGIGLFFTNNSIRLWDITKDAKDGDVLVVEASARTAECLFIFKYIADQQVLEYCYYRTSDKTFSPTGSFIGYLDDVYHPASKAERDILFKAMAEAGYTWDAETKTLSKIEEPTPEPEPKPTEEPTPEPVGTEEPTNKVAFDLIDYFSSVVKIEKHSKTYNYLLNLYDEAFLQFKLQNTTFGLPILYKKENFPAVLDYYGDKENEYAFEQLCAWLFALILEDIVPEHAEELVWMAYNYKINGANQPMYGYTFETDPHIARMVAGNIWAMTKIDDITQLREELGSKMVTYNKDISELYIHTELFMPTAPGPYLDEYKKRPKGLPVDANLTEHRDKEIHGFVSNIYNLSTDLPNIRQITFQAIANKDYHVEHLFGKPRTFIHPQYGEVTVYPVFGEHNVGICIPEDSEIATLCYEVGKNSSNNRKSLLNQEYGRRRPGQGEKDGTWNDVPEMRVLVDYPTEEYDGHSTGYYNQGGDYVDGNGNHIGDYNTYYQKAVYANSYPSGHSADIEAICNTLIRIMPELADLIIKAKNEFANSRIITRNHYQSDTIIGREIGTMFLPLMEACTNCNMKERYDKARQEYERIKNGTTPEPSPAPAPEPTEKVNTSLAYFIGGYGSCHVDAGEKEMVHRCTKQCTKERHPSITVNQRVNFTIEGGGVTTDDGKTSGVWEANTPYGIKCPAVTEDKYAYITMKNENGVKVLEYRCSKDGTHDDGAGKY